MPGRRPEGGLATAPGELPTLAVDHGWGMNQSTKADVLAMDAVELASMIAAGILSPVDSVAIALERLDAVEPRINAFCHVMREQAMADAERAKVQQASGATLPPLFGVPVSVKDLIAVADAPLRFGSRLFADNCSELDAPAVARLRAAGAIIIGKTTTSELGCKAVGDSPLTGFTRSPWDLSKTAGGSSAGAAASVAAGVTPVALGTDGGGSIRIPAALNGLFGFKAQFGRVPAFPRSATPSLAHVAPISRSVRDAALMLQVIAGHDPRDPGALHRAPPDFLGAVAGRRRPLKIAWSPDFGYAKPEAEVLRVAETALQTFLLWGCEIEQVELPFGRDPADAWTLQFYVQVAARLGAALDERPELLDAAVLTQLRRSSRQTALEYAQALAEQRDLQGRLGALFERFDVLVSPTLPVASVDVGVDIPPGQDLRNAVTWASYTYPFNLSGNPAASIPAGQTIAGHPVGLQIVSRPYAEAELLSLCAAYEAERPWRKLAPFR